jgi:Protein of unknown function (DUF2959)
VKGFAVFARRRARFVRGFARFVRRRARSVRLRARLVRRRARFVKGFAKTGAPSENTAHPVEIRARRVETAVGPANGCLCPSENRSGGFAIVERSRRKQIMRTVIVLAVLSCALSGCSSTRIAIGEAFGYAKREQLVDRVEEARDGQEAAKVQFASALDEFLALTGTDGGDLEAAYKKLSKQYDRSKSKAETVRGRIRSVERVADALFAEWETELGEYASEDMRQVSERQLTETRDRYDELLGAMKRAESKMDPVLAAFGDQVLFLKHNLNARAIASLDTEAASLEAEIGRLIAEMEASINEANAFIEDMK